MADENNNLFNNTNEQGYDYTPAQENEQNTPDAPDTAAQSEQSGQYYSAPQENTQQYYQPEQNNTQGGQYYAPQDNQQQYYQPPQGNPQYYQAPQGGYNPYAAPMPPQEQKANIGLAILSFFIPIVGIVLYFTQKREKPKTAKACGRAALVCIIINFFIGIIYSVIIGVAASKVATDPDASAYLNDFENYLNDYVGDDNSSSSVTNPDFSFEENNALSTAKDYLAYSAFSRQGLIDQLVYESYSEEVATKVVDSLDMDWNDQAAKMAQEYLDYSSFSRDGLIDQLIYEGFTAEQAEYGVNAVGY